MVLEQEVCLLPFKSRLSALRPDSFTQESNIEMIIAYCSTHSLSSTTGDRTPLLLELGTANGATRRGPAGHPDSVEADHIKR